MKKFSLVELIFLLIIPVVLGTIWFRSGDIMGAGESGLPFYDPKRILEIVSHTWAVPLLGGSIGIQVAAIPTDLIFSTLQNLGFPGFMIEAIFFIFLFFIAGLFIAFLTKALFPDLKKKYIFLTIWFYWFNPISLVTVWNRFLYNYMVFWALLPLSLWLFFKGMKNGNYRFAILTALSSVVFSYAFTSVVFTVLIIFTLLYTFLFFFFLEKNKSFYVKYFLIFLITFVLFNFWWIGQLYSVMLSSGYSSSVSKYFTSNDNLSTLQALSEKLGLLSYVFAFIHYDFFAGGLAWAKLFVSPLILSLNLLVMAAILWIIFKFRGYKEVIFLGLLMAIVIYLMKGISSPFGEIFQSIFLKIPPLQIFRNPFEKFSFLLPLAAAPLFGLAIQGLLQLVKKHSFMQFSIWIFVIGVMIFWSYPFWTGLIFTGDAIQVPDYYREANKWLNSREGNFRFVSLPLGGEGMTYTWDKSYSGVELSSALFDTPNISFNTSVPYFSDIVSNLTKYELDKRILEFFPFINGKYIVWRNDVDYKGRKMANPLVVKERLNQLVNDDLLSLEYDNKDLKIYALKDTSKQWPKIYISSNLVWTNDNDLSQFESYNKLFNNKFAIISSASTKPDNILIKPAKIISSFDKYRQKTSSENPLPMYSLPQEEHNSWIIYQFEVPYDNKYAIKLSEEKNNLKQYLDGKNITNQKNTEDNNYFALSKGFHEFALVGEEPDFLTPLINIDQFKTDNNRYAFNLVPTPKEYLIEFDYIPSENILNQSNFSPFIFEDVRNDNDPLYLQVIKKSDPKQAFSWAGYYMSTPGATNASLSFLPLGQNVCNKNFFGSRECKYNVGKLNIKINNLKIDRLEFPEVHLLTQNLVNKQYRTSLEWEKVNPTLYHVKINKQDYQPEVLVFSELFDSGWAINGQSLKLDASKHILVNSYANGWWLDKPGKYEINLEFMPERIFNIGKIISGTAIILCLILLLLDKFKRSK